jgi:ketosteroid isomerase-like protein
MSHEDVGVAAEALVAAFARHDRVAYFESFAPSATFLFHNFERVLTSRSEYEAVWRGWEDDGFRVLGCSSTNGAVTMLRDDLAVFTHTVRTQLKDGDSSVTVGERETIIFQLIDGRWLGVHEHLSPDPTVA